MTIELPSVLVIGAGELGKEILYSLSQHPRHDSCHIAALIRPSTLNSKDKSKQEFLQDLQSKHGISLVPGDIDDDDAPTLSSVFKQYHTVIGAAGMTQAKGIQFKIAEAVLAAAKGPDSKTKRYIPWQFGLHYDAIGPEAVNGMFAEQLRVRETLRANQQALSWVIVSTGIFTTFLFEPAFSVVEVVGQDRAVVRALGSWDNTVTYTTPRDIGRLTAEVAFSPEIKNQIVFVAGDTCTFAGVKTAVEAGLGRSVEGEQWSLDFLRKKLADEPENGMLKYQVVLAQAVGVSWDKRDTFNAERTIETQTVEQYARQHLKS